MSGARLCYTHGMPTFRTEDEYLDYLSRHLDKLPEAERKTVVDRIQQRAIEKARVSFLDYIKLIAPALNPDFTMGRHIEIIAARLDEMFHNAWKPSKTHQTDRQQVSMCPGASKSEVCTRLYPSWCLGMNPRTRFIIVGHGIDFAKDEYGEKVRDIMWSDPYKIIFPDTDLREDKQAANRFLTTKGGEVISTGIEAQVAGRRAHIIIVDDAIVEDKAASKNVREKLVSDYPSKHRSRLFMQFACAELIVGTRWCQGDLHDYLHDIDKNSGNPWRRIRVPALLDEEGVALLRREGDPEDLYALDTSFWPEFQPTHRLVSTRASYESNMPRWYAVYMQKPSVQAGQFVNPDHFRKWEFASRPPIHTICISIDPAGTAKEYSDPSGMSVWGLWNDSEDGVSATKAILIDYAEKKLGWIDQIKECERLYAKHAPDFFLIEHASAGIQLIPELQRRGYPVRKWENKPKMDKDLRMNVAATLVESGRVYLPFPTGMLKTIQKSMDFRDKICSYPNVPHDDLHDSFSQFLVWCKRMNIMKPAQWEDQRAYTPNDDEDDDDEVQTRRTYTQAY